MDIYQQLHERGRLCLRIFGMIPRDMLESAVAKGLRTGSGSEHLRIGCLKLFADGALGSQTALMFEPYEGSLDNFGIQIMTFEEMEHCIHSASSNGISVAIHAIGDRANHDAIKAIAKHKHRFEKYGLRPRIEHAQLLTKSDIVSFGRLGIIAAVQPLHAVSDREIAERFWGNRCRFAYPFESLARSGAVLALGSDAPVERPDPFAVLHAAVTRKRENEERLAWHPQEKIGLMQALKAYTQGSAQACCFDDITGEIRIGKRADFAVLSDDIFRIDKHQLPQIEVLMTVVDGKIAYRNPSYSL